jgi:hypothetical protein
MEAAAAGQTEFQRGKRFGAYVAKLVSGVDANPRIRTRHELHADFLALNGVARTKREGARRNPTSDRGEKQAERQAKMRPWQQGESIVARKWEEAKPETLFDPEGKRRV